MDEDKVRPSEQLNEGEVQKESLPLPSHQEARVYIGNYFGTEDSLEESSFQEERALG
jgi:hypothetical protein